MMDIKLLAEIRNILKVFSDYWQEDELVIYKEIDDIRDYNED